jgi:hypothetical protein
LDDSDDVIRASAVDGTTALLWRSTATGLALVADAHGRAITAPDVETVLRAATEAAVMTVPTPTERAFLQHALADQDTPRWHVSPAPTQGFPAAFAWFGPDDLHGAAPAVLKRRGQTVLWRSRPSVDAVTVAQDALAAQGVNAVAASCPPEAMTTVLKRSVSAAPVLSP